MTAASAFPPVSMSMTTGVSQILDHLRGGHAAQAEGVVQTLKVQGMVRERWRLLNSLIRSNGVSSLDNLHKSLVARGTTSEDVIFEQWKTALNAPSQAVPEPAQPVTRTQQEISIQAFFALLSTLSEEPFTPIIDFSTLATFRFFCKFVHKDNLPATQFAWYMGLDSYLKNDKTDVLIRVLDDVHENHHPLSDEMRVLYTLLKHFPKKELLKLNLIEMRKRLPSLALETAFAKAKIPSLPDEMTNNSLEVLNAHAVGSWVRLNIAMTQFLNQLLLLDKCIGELSEMKADAKKEKVNTLAATMKLTETFIYGNPDLSSQFKSIFLKFCHQYCKEVSSVKFWPFIPLYRQNQDLIENERTIDSWRIIYRQVQIFFEGMRDYTENQMTLLKQFKTINIFIRTYDLKKLELDWKQSKLPFHEFFANQVKSYAITPAILERVQVIDPSFKNEMSMDQFAGFFVMAQQNSALNGIFYVPLKICSNIDQRLREVTKATAKTKKLETYSQTASAGAGTFPQPSERDGDVKDWKSDSALITTNKVESSIASAVDQLPLNTLGDIERLIFDSFGNLVGALSMPGTKNSALNAQMHMQNGFRQLHRLTSTFSNPMDKELVFCEVVKLIDEGSLALELLLCAMTLQIHNQDVSTISNYYTHDFEVYLGHCKEHLSELRMQDIRVLLGLNRGEILSRRLARLYVWGRLPTQVEKLLMDIYQWYSDVKVKDMPKNLLNQIVEWNRSVCNLAFKLCQNGAKLSKKGASQAVYKKGLENLEASLDQFGIYLEHCCTKPVPAKAITASIGLQASSDLDRMERLLISFDMGYFANSKANILMNLMRLKKEMKQQISLLPQDISLHMSTVLKLNQLIVEEFLEVKLALKGIVVDRERVAHDCWQLVDLLKMQNKFTPNEMTFLKEGRLIRKETRYIKQEETMSESKSSSTKMKLKKAIQTSKKNTAAASVAAPEEGFDLPKSVASAVQQFDSCKKVVEADVKTMLEIMMKLSLE